MEWLLNMNDKRRNYYIVSKSWWRNMNNIVINYRHRSEEGSMYLVHMSTPKERIDRLCAIKGCGWFR